VILLKRLASINDTFLTMVAENIEIKTAISDVRQLIYSQTELDVINSKIANLEKEIDALKAQRQARESSIEELNRSVSEFQQDLPLGTVRVPDKQNSSGVGVGLWLLKGPAPNAPLAHLVEHLFRKQGVTRSNRVRGSLSVTYESSRKQNSKVNKRVRSSAGSSSALLRRRSSVRFRPDPLHSRTWYT
jgi:uncharacterized small protein (DUF1192 family)